MFTLLYNDEHPDGNTSFTAGHTKGVVALGDQRGFWLVHSVPKFPPVAGKYGYPRTGHMYGQTFLCITLETAANADALGVQVGDAICRMENYRATFWGNFLLVQFVDHQEVHPSINP